MAKKKIALTWNNSVSAFRQYLPNIDIIRSYQQVKNYDLIIFPGGEDVDPHRYGEPNLHCLGTNPNRDEIESEMFHYALQAEKQMIGICRGCQLLNVFLGGNLYQDIFEQATGNHPQLHPLSWKTQDDPFYKFFGEKKRIVSTHHQAIKRVQRGTVILATFKDIPEVVKVSNKFIYMFQFHPEFEPGNEAFFKFISEEW